MLPFPGSELELPCLTDQVVPEAVVRVFVDETIAGTLIEVPSGEEHAVCPQHDLPITGLSRKARAFVHQTGADTESTSPRFHEQQTQLSHRLRFLHEQNAAEVDAVLLRDPAAFALAIEFPHELGDHFSHQCLELLIPPILVRVESTVPLHDPPKVTWLRWAEHVRHLGVGGTTEDLFDQIHRRHQPTLRLSR